MFNSFFRSRCFSGSKQPKVGIVEGVVAVDGDTTLSQSTSEVLNEEIEAVANAHLQTFKKLHQFDPNLPEDLRDAVDHAADTQDLSDELKLEHTVNDNSPYPEVRAAVRN